MAEPFILKEQVARIFCAYAWVIWPPASLVDALILSLAPERSGSLSNSKGKTRHRPGLLNTQGQNYMDIGRAVKYLIHESMKG